MLRTPSTALLPASSGISSKGCCEPLLCEAWLVQTLQTSRRVQLSSLPATSPPITHGKGRGGEPALLDVGDGALEDGLLLLVDHLREVLFEREVGGETTDSGINDDEFYLKDTV